MFSKDSRDLILALHTQSFEKTENVFKKYKCPFLQGFFCLIKSVREFWNPTSRCAKKVEEEIIWKKIENIEEQGFDLLFFFQSANLKLW